MSKTLISGGYAPSISVSEFLVSQHLDLMNRLPTIFIAYLDSLSICFSLGLMLFNFQGTSGFVYFAKPCYGEIRLL